MDSDAPGCLAWLRYFAYGWIVDWWRNRKASKP